MLRATTEYNHVSRRLWIHQAWVGLSRSLTVLRVAAVRWQLRLAHSSALTYNFCCNDSHGQKHQLRLVGFCMVSVFLCGLSLQSQGKQTFYAANESLKVGVAREPDRRCLVFLTYIWKSLSYHLLCSLLVTFASQVRGELKSTLVGDVICIGNIGRAIFGKYILLFQPEHLHFSIVTQYYDVQYYCYIVLSCIFPS